MKKSASATRLSEAPELRQSDTSNSLRTTKTQVPSKRKLTLSNATMKAAGTKDDDQHKDSAEKSLVRYINKVMIKKISGKEELRDITTLNLILTTKDNGKKIRYIENLEGLTNLQVLMINHNQISKIENLHHLMRLRELNISCNRINKVEGLETLTHLQTLNLSHNLIETIPAWLAKKLTALRAFHIAGNLLYSLSDVFRLRPLKDLMQLSIADNPLCDLPHHRLFAAFHLRTLQVLDKQTITESERKQADDRFEQEELENLEVQLNNEEKKLRSLQENHSKTLMDQQQSMNLIALLKTKNLAHQQTIIQLHGEVHAKDDLLKRKTAELNKACEKQFRLEQELAFQKIDAKFEPLAFHLDIDEAEGGTEESPYIGKAGYKRNELARQQYFDPSKGQSIRESQQQGQEVLDIDPSPEIQEQLHDVLQDRLTDKQRQIAAAQEQLGKLQDKITDAKKMLDDKNREIQRMSTKSTKRPLSESEKQELKRCLWERLHAVNNLKQRVAELEEAMEASLYIVQIKEREMERLKHQLPNQKHPQYAEAATEISSKEQELTDAGDKYQDLQRELEEIVALLSEEMENVNQVKEQVAQAKVDLNDNLKEELEDAIAGLTTLMQEAQRKAKKEDCKNKFLQRERDPLLGQQQQAEKGKTGLGEDDFMPRDLEDIQRRLAGLQAALAAAEAEKHQLKATLQAEHNSKQAEENETLKAAKEADRLNTALRRQKQQAQLENGVLKKQLYAQRRQVEALRQSIDQSHDCAKNEVVANLLGKLQAQREELEDQLYSQQEQMQEALGALLHPSDVIARISQLQRHLEQGRGKTKPFDDKDILGKSLAELEDLMRERLREKEEACKQQKKAEREADTLRKQMAALKEQLEQVENECARLDVDSPDFSLEEIKVIRQQHNARENIGENKARQEEDAMMEALRGQVRTLQEKLKRHQPHHFVQVESLAKARARQIAQELARAEDKMLKLHQALVDREKLLQQEMQRGDVASQTLATQQIQMDALYDTLEEQKAEILKLHDALNRLVIPKPGMAAAQPSVRDYDIEHLLREIERLNYALQQQEKHMSTQGLLQFGDRPINNLRPTFVGDLQAGLHPIPYTYTSPEQPTGKAADHLQSQTSPIRTYQQYLSPASTHNTVQDFPTNQPTDQQQEFPQSSGHTRPGRILSSVASMMQPVGNTYGQQQAADTQTSSVHVPVLLANAQTFGTTEVQQQVGIVPGTKGTRGIVQETPTVQSGVVSPTSQPVITQVPISLQGAPTPGLVLRTTVPSQPTPLRDSGHNSEENTHTCDGMAGTEGKSESAQTERGKNSRTIILPQGSLFCNVHEHHWMEDEVARLKRLLAECRKYERKRADSETEKFESVLENQNKELEMLELAIQRQRETLRVLHNADIDIRRERDAAVRELEELNSNIDRKTCRRDFLEGRKTITPEETDYKLLDAYIHQDHQNDEIECLGRTLVKRRAELRVADQLLQECQAELKDATEKVRSTLEQYDKASKNLKQTVEDAEEIEKRSLQASRDLLQVQDHLGNMQQEVKDIEEKRQSREEKMKAVDEVLSEKDNMFRVLEGKIERATHRLQKLQIDSLLLEEKTAKQQDSAKQQNQLIAERTTELHKLEEQVEEESKRLIEIDHEIGSKQTDLNNLISDLDNNSKDLVIALRDAENELMSFKQKIKETRVILNDLNNQKRDLLASIEDQHSILARYHLDTEKEERTLQDVRASIDKSRTDLKHTLEMIQLEKTELEALRLQHESKMGDLEKTQLAALQEKAELETLQVSCKEKHAQVERIQKQLNLQRPEKERLTTELSAMEARAVVLHREEEGLEEKCREWDSKVVQLAKQHTDLLASGKTEEAKQEELLQDLTTGQEKLDKINSKRVQVTNQFQSLKQQVKETGKDLRMARDDLQKVKNERHHIQQELQEHEQHKAEAQGNLARLRASIEKTQQSLMHITVELGTKQEALHQLNRDVVEHHQEAESSQQHVERVQADVEQEENRLSRLIGGMTVEAEHLCSDVAMKRQELEEIGLQLIKVQTQCEEQQQSRKTITELQAQIKELESGKKERLEEKTKLVEALNFSHSEINSFRKEKENVEKILSETMSQLDEANDRLYQAKQRFKNRQTELEQEIKEANTATDEHCLQADRLSLKLKEVTQLYIQLQSQSLREIEEERRAKTEALAKWRELLQKAETPSIGGTSDPDELEDEHQQKLDLTKHLVELQSNIHLARLDASLIRDGDFLADVSSADESRWRQYNERAKIQEEQDRLKLLIDQRVSYQADMLDCAKERTNSTLHCLKDKLDNLEGLVNNNSVVARSLTSTHTSVDSETSLNNELGRGSSDRYPQHDTSPVKIISSKYRPVRRISKPTQEVQQPPRTSVPSCTFASKPHHQTCPERTEQPKQGHTDNDSERLDDLMNSIQRLKEEKLAQIECSSPLTKLCNE